MTDSGEQLGLDHALRSIRHRLEALEAVPAVPPEPAWTCVNEIGASVFSYGTKYGNHIGPAVLDLREGDFVEIHFERHEGIGTITVKAQDGLFNGTGTVDLFRLGHYQLRDLTDIAIWELLNVAWKIAMEDARQARQRVIDGRKA